MILTALLLTLVGLAYATEGIGRAFRALGLDLGEVLVYFGLAEVVEPPRGPAIEVRDGRRLTARGAVASASRSPR